MDMLQISGKQYISSHRAAKDNGYTTDYIGQLIRAGKLKGQKVGRAWYVLDESLQAFLAKEGTSEVPVSDDKETEAVPPEEIIEIEKPEKEAEEKEEERKEEVVLKIHTEPEPKLAEEIEEERHDFHSPEIQNTAEEEKEREKEEKKLETVFEETLAATEPVPAEPKPAPVVVAPKVEPVKSVRQHVLMNYLKEESSNLPLDRKKDAETPISIHAVVEESRAADTVPAKHVPIVTMHPRPRKRSRWKAVIFITLLGILFGAGTTAAAVLIPTLLIYP